LKKVSAGLEKRRKLPPLNALRSFEAVGRHGSITGAAKELLVTEPAVSRALKNLEEHFGMPLFHRHTGGWKLTEHGKILLPDISAALDRIAVASSMVYEQRRYSISILVTPFVATHLIAKHIGSFMEAHPDVSVRVHSSFRFEELYQADFDVAIWNGEGVRKGYERVLLFNLDRLPLCSKEFADRNFQSQEPGELENAALIHEYDYSDWMAWFDEAGLEKNKAARGLVSDNFESILQSTINGAGVAILFERFLRDPKLSDLLVAPFKDDILVGTDYSAYYQTGQSDNPAIAKFVDFLIDLGPDIDL